MPSAANAKSEKPASSEATDNSPVRQIITILEHKIRNLEKRKGKLTSYRDLQKAGKPLKEDQKIAVAKYDEVTQTLEFARDLFKQVTSIASTAEREAKKQAKKEAWVRYAAETNKIREILLFLDCISQMGNSDARNDFLNGTNGAAKLSEEDLKILDDIYPEVTPKHEVNEVGKPGFPASINKSAEHLYSIIEGKPKEVIGTTYAKIKEITNTIHSCGYFDKVPGEVGIEEPSSVTAIEEPLPQVELVEPELVIETPQFPHPPPAAVVPPPAYPLRPLPPITLQEVEHAYFAHQYPAQRPIAEVIGSQNFYFLQESELDSPGRSPPPIPSQTFTNHHFVRVEPLPAHYAPPVPLPLPHGHEYGPPPMAQQSQHQSQPLGQPQPQPQLEPESVEQDSQLNTEEYQAPETHSPENRARGQGESRPRRYPRPPRTNNDNYRPRAFNNNNNHRRDNQDYQFRRDKDDYQPQRRDNNDYQPQRRENNDYQSQRRDNSDYQPQRRENNDYHTQRRDRDDYQRRDRDEFQQRPHNRDRRNGDHYVGNGDSADIKENGGPPRPRRGPRPQPRPRPQAAPTSAH